MTEVIDELPKNSKRFMNFLKKCPQMTDTPLLRSAEFGEEFKDMLPSIQYLSDKGHITMLTVNGELCFRISSDSARKHFNKFKGMTEVELLTYRIVKAAGNRGIVLNELRYKVQLHNYSNQLKRILNKLTSKKLIKMFKPFNDPHKKYYILFELRPAKEVQGGIWYSKGEQDEGALRAMDIILFGKKGLMNKDYKSTGCTAAQLTEQISSRNLFHGDTVMSLCDVEQYLERNYYDGKLERIRTNKGATLYVKKDRSTEETTRRIQNITSTPCGTCTLQNQCTPDGVISPGSCPYLVDWMGSF